MSSSTTLHFITGKGLSIVVCALFHFRLGCSKYDFSSASKIYMPLSHYCYINSNAYDDSQQNHTFQLQCTAKTPSHCFKSIIIKLKTVDTSQQWLLSLYFPIHWVCCIARIIMLSSYDERAASPLHRNTPIQHTISFYHQSMYFVASESRGYHGLHHSLRYVPPMMQLFV